jgi:hypothetical protein
VLVMTAMWNTEWNYIGDYGSKQCILDSLLNECMNECMNVSYASMYNRMTMQSHPDLKTIAHPILTQSI